MNLKKTLENARIAKAKREEEELIFSTGFSHINFAGAISHSVEENPRAVTKLDKEIDSAISGAAPQIIKPEPPAKPIKVIDLIPIGQTKPEDFIAIHSYPPNSGVKDKEKRRELLEWRKLLDGLPKNYDDKDDWTVDEDDNGNWAGTFQPSLKPPTTPTPATLKFSTWVSIGSPKNGGVRLNCIENSRGEFIYFKDSRDIIREAVAVFNRDYVNESRRKTVLAGTDESEYVNFSLTFDYLSYENRAISVNFEKYEFVTGGGKNLTEKLINPVDCIKNSCQFYLEGEIMLDDTETKIEAMKIFAINYINTNRMKKGDKFVYIA